MNQEHQRSLLGDGDVGNYTVTSLSHPITRISTHSDLEHRILIDDEPQNYSSSDDDDAESPSLLSRDCGYFRPFMFLDMMWNMAFVLVSVFVLLTSIQERPSTPLRFWIFGYALQCLLHVGFVWVDYQKRSLVDGGVQVLRRGRAFSFSFICRNSITKKLESINTIVSSVWWVFGFYWTAMGGQLLLQYSPRLYWLSVVFLAVDVFFIIFCIMMACIIFFVLFCCFPVLATIAYAVTIGEGASENDIRSLPKYLFRQQSAGGTYKNDKQEDINLTAKSGNSISAPELVLQPEDSECCICLYKYVDGTELCTLPCNHHFHHNCISKWLRINATCPLCKSNILRGNALV